MLSLCLPDLFLLKHLLTTLFIIRNSFLSVPGFTMPDVGDPFCQTNKMQKIYLFPPCPRVGNLQLLKAGIVGQWALLLLSYKLL